ncbi:YajQ family cyclic di-GMP-binding protein [Campylobacter lari]|uniref:YajQ family cyclic di-GMP-binding protein n=1 Tax=Campylobacter lari TaxID=201 RepID=UPI00128573C7|nr:YajQ family cyclic di-GMP-binding protein [Campylobacter lari]MBT0742663.1 YajQ family cyclic di-GMP-binding protein [Campylobacter lari]MCR6540299.1 YajQ family cyclic di-GMP-binding protein [Campylobacter lari]
MASEHSFDISGEIDKQELKNALEQAKKELDSRYDLKGIKSEIELNEKESVYKLICSSEAKLEVLKDIVISKLIKRGINPNGIKELSRESGANFRLNLKVNDTIDTDSAKKINKAIKDSKLKVTSSIRGNEIRVVSKQIDDLQSVMKIVKELNLELNLSFKNLK